jgi:hypothetical protein
MPPAPRQSLPRRIRALATDPAPPVWARTAPWFFGAIVAAAAIHAGDVSGMMSQSIHLYVAGEDARTQRPPPAPDGTPAYDEQWSGSLTVQYDISLFNTWRTVDARLSFNGRFDPDMNALPPPTPPETANRDERLRRALDDQQIRFGPFDHIPADLGPAVTRSLARAGATVREIDPLGYLLKALELLAIAVVIASPVVVALRLLNHARCQRMLHRWSRARCPTCNYDISPDPEATCPECGTKPLAARQHALESLNRRLRREPEYAEDAEQSQRPQRKQTRSGPGV